MQVVCYFGKATRNGDAMAPSDSLLATCRDFTQRNGLTGLLAVADGYFLHFLEGKDAAVQALVARIAAFWDHESPSVLFEHAIAERSYGQWSVAMAQRSNKMPPMEQRLAYIRGFLDSDHSASAADAFRYFLTPSRTGKPQRPDGPVRQVAIFSNSVLWFNPIFSHLSERFGTKACALKISDTGRDADAYPLDYADVVGDTVGPVRLVGISESLLESTLSSPLLRNVELMVFLMRRSGQGGDTAFVAKALAHPMVQQTRPGVLFITPADNAELSRSLQGLVAGAGLQGSETTGSVLAGGPIWNAIHERLAAAAPEQPGDGGEPAAADAAPPALDAGIDIDLSQPMPPRQDEARPAAPAAQAAPDDAAGPSPITLHDTLDRLVAQLPAAAWCAWFDVLAHEVLAAAGAVPSPEAVEAALASAVVDVTALQAAGQRIEELAANFTHVHQVLVPHPARATLVLWVMAPRDDIPFAMLRRHIHGCL